MGRLAVLNACAGAYKAIALKFIIRLVESLMDFVLLVPPPFRH